MADEEWFDLGTAKAVLESWFSIELSSKDMEKMLITLLENDLVQCTVKSQALRAGRLKLPEDLQLVEFKATGKGVRYLAKPRGGDAV